MEHQENQTELKPGQVIYVVQGTSGTYEDKTYWTVQAHSTEHAAEKVKFFLQREADKIDHVDPADTGSYSNAVNNLKQFDLYAWHNDGGIIYFVEAIKYYG